MQKSVLIALAVAVTAGAALFMARTAPAAPASNLSQATAFVKKQCPGSQRHISTDLWEADFRFNALYGNCRANDGTDQHVWFFDGSRFVGKDAPTPSHDIIGLWRDDKTIAFMYVLYRPSDPNCCPTAGGAIVRFRWNGKRAQPLDRLPAGR